MRQPRLARSVALFLGLLAAPAVLVASGPADGVDADGDGWTVADGDCCDEPGQPCEVPALVNPGAFEAGGDQLDNDCDGTIDNPAPTDCSATPQLTGLTGTLLAQAIDLCQATTPSPPPAARRWGLISATLARADGSAPSPAAFFDRQIAVLADFGATLPTANATMAVFSTGHARDAADPNFVAPDGGLDWGSSVIAPLVVATPCGTNVIPAHDSVLLALEVRVPTNATGLRFDANFYTAEYPDDCLFGPYNDQALALVTGGSPQLPPDGNILFDSQGSPVSAHTAFFEVCTPVPPHTCPSGPAALTGSGYDVPVADGASTSWLNVDAPVVPGETILLRLVLFDGNDGNLDSALLLDGLRWTITPNAALLVFADGFESGDTAAWSLAVP